MTITVGNESYDTMKEACERLSISRQTLLNYIKNGIFNEPPTVKQGRKKFVRYFPDDWYVHAERAMAE